MGSGQEQGQKRLSICSADGVEGMNPLFFSSPSHSRIEEAYKKPLFCDDLPRTLQFWPIVGWVNYQYMPLQFRVVFHSFVASCWSVSPPPTDPLSPTLPFITPFYIMYLFDD